MRLRDVLLALGLLCGTAPAATEVVEDKPVLKDEGLKREKLQPQRTIATEDSAYAAVLSGDGSRIAYVGHDHTVRVIDIKSGGVVGRAAGHKLPITHLSISTDGKRLAGYSAEANRLLVWEADTGKAAFERQFERGSATPRAFAFTRDGSQLVGTETGALLVFDARTGNAKAEAGTDFPGPMCDIALSRDDKTVYMADSGGRFYVWDRPAGRVLHTGVGHDARWETLLLSWRPPVRVVLSPDGALAATLSVWYNQLRVWRASDAVRKFDNRGQGRYRGAHCCTFSPDGKRLVTGENDGLVGFWDTSDGSLLAAFGTDIWHIRWISFLPDGKTLVTLDDKALKFWDAAEGMFKAVTDTAPPAELTVSRSDSWYFSTEFSGDGAGVFSRDGSAWLMPGTDGVEEYELARGRKTREWATPDLPFLHPVAASVDAGLVFRFRAGVAAGIWNYRTGARRCELENPWLLGGEAELSPDGAYLAWSGSNGPGDAAATAVWDAATGRRLWSNPAAIGAFAADSRTLALRDETHVLLCSAADGRVVARVGEGYDNVRSAAFCKGRLVVGASLPGEKQGAIDFWDEAGKTLVRRLKTPLCDNVCVSADGRLLVATRPGAGTIRLWDTAAFTVLRTFRDSEEWLPVRHLRLAADGRHLSLRADRHWSLYHVPMLTDLQQRRAIEQMRPQFVRFESGLLALSFEQSVTDEDLAGVAELNSPTKIGLSYCNNITDAGVRRLAAGRSIIDLELPERTTDGGLAALAGLRLRRLQHSGDGVTDAGLAVVAGMTEMEELSLSGNKLTAGCLRHLAKMSKLRSLSLYATLKSADVAALLPLTGMEELGPTLQIDGPALARLAAAMPRLRTLNLSGSELTDESLAALAGLKELRSLDLSDTGITDAGLVRLAGLTKLERLDIGGNPDIRGPGLVHLAKLKALKDVTLGGTGITGPGLAALSDTAVTKLNLAECPVDDPGLTAVGKLRRLKFLTLPAKITDAGLWRLASLENLETLDVSKGNLTGKGFADLAGLPKLTNLHLADSRITNDGLAGIGRLTRLKTLDLSRTGIGDDGLRHLAPLGELENLDLEGTAVTDAGLANLARLYSLKYIGNGQTRVTDARRDQLTNHTGPFARPLARIQTAEKDDGEAIWFSADGKTVSLWMKKSIFTVPAAAAEKAEATTVDVERAADLWYLHVEAPATGDAVALQSSGHVVVCGRDGRRLAGIEKTERPNLRRPAFSPDGKRLLLASDFRLEIVDVESGKTVREVPFAIPFAKNAGDWRTRYEQVTGLCNIGPVVTDGEMVMVVDMDKPASPRRLTGLTTTVTGLAVSPDGGRVAAAGWGELIVWDAATGKALHQFMGVDTTMEMLRFSPDGRRLAARGSSKGMHVFELGGARRHINFESSGEVISQFAFSPDGRRLAVAQRSFGPLSLQIAELDDWFPPIAEPRK